MRLTLFSRTWVRAAEALRSSVNPRYLATQALLWAAGFAGLWLLDKAFTFESAGNVPTLIGISLSAVLTAVIISLALLSALDEVSGPGAQLQSLIPDLNSAFRVLPLMLVALALTALLLQGGAATGIALALSFPLPLAFFAAADSYEPAGAQLKNWCRTLRLHPLEALLQWFTVMFVFTAVLFASGFPLLLIIALPFATLFSAATYRDLHEF